MCEYNGVLLTDNEYEELVKSELVDNAEEFKAGYAGALFTQFPGHEDDTPETTQNRNAVVIFGHDSEEVVKVHAYDNDGLYVELILDAEHLRILAGVLEGWASYVDGEVETPVEGVVNVLPDLDIAPDEHFSLPPQQQQASVVYPEGAPTYGNLDDEVDAPTTDPVSVQEKVGVFDSLRRYFFGHD